MSAGAAWGDWGSNRAGRATVSEPSPGRRARLEARDGRIIEKRPGSNVSRGLWTLAPLAAGLLLAHLVQNFVILPNLCASNWFGRLIAGRGTIPFNYALAAMCCIAALPVAIAALFSGKLLRSAAERLDRLVTD